MHAFLQCYGETDSYLYLRIVSSTNRKYFASMKSKVRYSLEETDKVVLPFVFLLGLVIAIISIGMETVWAGTFLGTNGKIAFDSFRDGNYEIYVMNADGSGQTNVSNNGATDIFPSWSPDGTKIAFASNRDVFFSFLPEIYVMNADGSGQTRLTDNLASDSRPSWSPDGTKIAFDTGRDGNFEVYVMNADGSGQTNLTKDPAFDLAPSWSPDGTKIAFASESEGNREVYVMNADGSGRTNLTNNAAPEDSPNWGPLATQLVGGEILGIDATSLFVAGAFANAGWIIPIVGATAGGILGFVLRKRIR